MSKFEFIVRAKEFLNRKLTRQQLALLSISVLLLVPQVTALLPVFRWLRSVVLHPIALTVLRFNALPLLPRGHTFLVVLYTSKNILLTLSALASIAVWLALCVAVALICFKLTLFCVSFCLRAVARNRRHYVHTK